MAAGALVCGAVAAAKPGNRGIGGKSNSFWVPCSISTSAVTILRRLRMNGVAASSNKRDDLTADPYYLTSYSWGERDQLSTALPPFYPSPDSFFYDAFGRRESFDDLGVVWSYLYDSLMAVEANSNTGARAFSPTPAVKCWPIRQVRAPSFH